jgi:hypothetical protein
MRRILFFTVAIVLAMVSPLPSLAQQAQTIKIPKGQTVDIWFGVNVSGKLHLAVRTRDGRNKINMWWLTWGVGSTTAIGDWGPNGDLDIPITWWRGVVSAKLRGTAAEDTVVYVSERVSVDKSVTFKW